MSQIPERYMSHIPEHDIVLILAVHFCRRCLSARVTGNGANAARR
jgi:hypothetical protein